MKTNLNVGIVVTFLAHFATSRPQSQGVTLVGGFIPIVSNTVRFPGEEATQSGLKQDSPSYSAPHLYVAPIFDEFGDPLPTSAPLLKNVDLEEVEEDNVIEDYAEEADEIFQEAVEEEEAPEAKNLPEFQGVDLLKATEVLRSHDANQESIVDPGTVNAGVLPLSSDASFIDVDQLYPPLFHP